MGIKQDPIPGEKRGKGAQHLMSSQWLAAMAEFAGAHAREMAAFARRGAAEEAAEAGGAFLYFINTAHQLMLRAESHGLKSRASLDTWLMRCE